MRPLIKRQYRGRVGNDGNGMVGGRWWSCTRLAHKEIPIADLIPDRADPDAVCAYFIEKGWGDDYPFVEVEAYFTTGADESVGLPEICDLDESFVPADFDKAIDDCPFLTKPDGEALKDKVRDIADDEDDYVFYEIDVPEKEELIWDTL